MAKKHRSRRVVLVSLLVLVAVCVGGFYVWAEDFYRADDAAAAVLLSDDSIEISGNMTILKPSSSDGVGIIFYPGAKVEHTAYLPLLERLKDEGFTCVLVEMPLNMAIFDADAADGVIAALPEVERWYIAGHSMGGAMASSYASKHQDRVEGLILLGAYIYGDYPPSKTLTIYGSFNDNLEKDIHYTENIVKIEGGNHAQFGNYGRQQGDPDATISADEQQRITAAAIVSFIRKTAYTY